MNQKIKIITILMILLLGLSVMAENNTNMPYPDNSTSSNGGGTGTTNTGSPTTGGGGGGSQTTRIETYKEGDTIDKVYLSIDGKPDTGFIKVNEIAQLGTDATSFEAKLSLYSFSSNTTMPIYTKTVRIGDDLRNIFSNNAGYSLKTPIKIVNISVESTTGIGYIQIEINRENFTAPEPTHETVPTTSSGPASTTTASAYPEPQYTGKPYFKNISSEYTFMAKNQLHIKFEVYGNSWEQFAVYPPNNSLPEGWTYETFPQLGYTGVHLWVPDTQWVKAGIYTINWTAEASPNDKSTATMKVTVLQNQPEELNEPAFKNLQKEYFTNSGRRFSMSFDVYGKQGKMSVYPTQLLPVGATYGNDFEEGHTRVNLVWDNPVPGKYEITYIAKAGDNYQSKATFRIIVADGTVDQYTSTEPYVMPSTSDCGKMVEELKKEIEMLRKKIEALQTQRNITGMTTTSASTTSASPSTTATATTTPIMPSSTSTSGGYSMPTSVTSTGVYTGNVEIVKPTSASPVSVSVENGSTTVSTGTYKQEIDEAKIKKALQNKGINTEGAKGITVTPVTDNGLISYEVRIDFPNKTPIIQWFIPTETTTTTVSSAAVIDAAGN